MATIRTLLLDAIAQNPNGIAVRWKTKGQWLTWTYKEYLNQARIVSEVANKLGIRPGQRVAVMMENRPEWMVTYLGLVCVGIEIVPIDARLQPGEVSYILRDAEACAIFASGKLWPLIQEVEQGLSLLRNVVLLDGVFAETTKVSGIKHYDYLQLLESVAEDSKSPDSFFDRNVPLEDNVASIIYTSGTTGRPKGAMLTNGNFTAQIDGAFKYFTVRPNDNFLLVLPLHHAFAFTANFVVPIAATCEVSIVENLRTVAENMKEVSPTILIAVPLLAEKMLNGINAKLKNNHIAKFLMSIGLSKVVGKKVVEGLGGKWRILVAGGAASDIEMLKAYTKFGILTLEGYGLTETAPICSLSPETDIRFGTVGKSLPNCEMRIDCPNEDGIGEIQVRGPIVMKGYFRNESATAEVFDNGWFRTGDLGKIDADGYVTITGRKKSMIVNREGKNIYPEEVEMAVNASSYILESLVLGYRTSENKGERVGIIVVPNMDHIAGERGNRDAPLTDEEVVQLCRTEVHKMVKSISEYKHPRRIQVRFEPFEKTSTQKIKRYLYNMNVSEE